MFHTLIRKQRKNRNDFTTDLHVGDQCFTGEDNILKGFKIHSEQLAELKDNPTFDKELMIWSNMNSIKLKT